MPATRTRTTAATDRRGAFARAQEFNRRLLRAAAGRVEDHALGEAVHTPELPSAWYLNQLVVDVEDVGADELVAALDAAYGDVRHRRALVEHDALGARLAPALRERGWQAERDVYQVLGASGDHAAAPGPAREVDPPTLQAVERCTMLEDAADPAVIDQLLAMRGRFIRIGRGRCFVARDGDLDVAHATLYSDETIAQVEDVATLRAHRGRGLGRAVVAAATQAALASGHEVVFIMADAGDWPQELYRRLGFEDAGASWAFTLPDRGGQ